MYFFSEEGFFVEIAKNLEQLKAWLVFDFLCNIPEIEEVELFSESIKFCKSDEIDNIFSECDDVTDLININIFKKIHLELLRKAKDLDNLIGI